MQIYDKPKCYVNVRHVHHLHINEPIEVFYMAGTSLSLNHPQDPVTNACYVYACKYHAWMLRDKGFKSESELTNI